MPRALAKRRISAVGILSLTTSDAAPDHSRGVDCGRLTRVTGLARLGPAKLDSGVTEAYLGSQLTGRLVVLPARTLGGP